MKKYTDISIKRKLLFLVLGVTGICLFIFFAFVSMRQFSSSKKDLVETSLAQTRLVAEYSVSPLVFQDKKGAEEVLQKLQSVSNFKKAVLFDEDHLLFSSFQSKPSLSDAQLTEQTEVGHFFEGDELFVLQPVVYGQKQYGKVLMVFSSDELYEKLWEFLLTSGMLFVGIFVVAYLSADRLQHIISGPILHLAFLTRRVSESEEYATRVKKMGNDEIGELYDGFNHMMGQLEKRKSEQEMLTDELTKQNNELQQFAYIVSHDLRAPVLNLCTLVDFLNRNNPDDPSNPIIIEKIDNSSKQIKNTLNDLIEIVSAKKRPDERKERIVLDHFISGLLKSIESQTDSVDAKIVYDFSDAREIYFPPGNLRSVFINLLTNAIKYRSPERTPVIKIRSERKNDDFIQIFVSDNGTGIDMEKYGGDLFKLYKRFHDTVEGKGIGLYIIKSQIEALGGTITAESTVNKGTTFIITLRSKVEALQPA